ncbi:MAG: helix-turn-helix domain-containing protein [Blautia wexlerae]
MVRTGGSRHTGLAAPPHRNIQFDVLAVMARHPGRVYTYAQICRMIYGETDVGEETYSSAYCLISSLRKKLEKDPRHPRYLHTVYGVGYRFEGVLEK